MNGAVIRGGKRISETSISNLAKYCLTIALLDRESAQRTVDVIAARVRTGTVVRPNILQRIAVVFPLSAGFLDYFD